jgi:hypothetical protein
MKPVVLDLGVHFEKRPIPNIHLMMCLSITRSTVRMMTMKNRSGKDNAFCPQIIAFLQRNIAVTLNIGKDPWEHFLFLHYI